MAFWKKTCYNSPLYHHLFLYWALAMLCGHTNYISDCVEHRSINLSLLNLIEWNYSKTLEQMLCKKRAIILLKISPLFCILYIPRCKNNLYFPLVMLLSRFFSIILQRKHCNIAINEENNIICSNVRCLCNLIRSKRNKLTL